MKFSFSFILLLVYLSTTAQLSISDKKIIQEKEKKLKFLSGKIIYAASPQERIQADSMFIRELVTTLKINNSFAYQFDSVQSVSLLYAPDSTFRIFTWQLIVDDFQVRQKGAIQMKTANGALVLFPLIDVSDFTSNMSDTSADNFGWIGAVYYKIILKKINSQCYYTLLGYDENNIRSTKKIIELLQFKDGKPWFGGRNFLVPDNSLSAQSKARYIMEFKKDAGPRLTFDDDLDMIVMEHLISESNEPDKLWTLIGDGDYDGFKWENGRWNYVEKIFNQVTPDGQPPTPQPIRNNDGSYLSTDTDSGSIHTKDDEKQKK